MVYCVGKKIIIGYTDYHSEDESKGISPVLNPKTGMQNNHCSHCQGTLVVKILTGKQVENCNFHHIDSLKTLGALNLMDEPIAMGSS